MIVSDVETAARQRYNAISDNFWSPAEIYNLIYFAQLELARETNIIERLYSTSSVAAQSAYPYPANSMGVKRITWNGIPMLPIDMRDDDILTGNNQATLAMGDPQYYYLWNKSIYLRPTPSSVQTIQLFSYDLPSAVTVAGASLDVPLETHPMLIDYCLREMCAKDKIVIMAQYYGSLWERNKVECLALQKRRKRYDSFGIVKDQDNLNPFLLGSL